MSKIALQNFLLICLNFSFSSIKCENPDYKIISTENGFFKGLRQRTLYENREYFSFRGIPYAKPPLNDLRFQLPEKPDPWIDIKSVLETGSDCVQLNPFRESEIIGDEDCLFLNVYTPNVDPNKKLPVMFFIHGGGYFDSSSSEAFYGPDFLIEENVILVTINYRLGPLGFLSIDGLPKNVGLHDQLLALKWVNENIHNFGGYENEITIFGESAGASSVHFLILSPLSNNCFKRAILQSGTALDTWAYGDSQHNQNEMMMNYGLDKGDLIKFLKSVDAKTFIRDNFVNPFPTDPGERGYRLVFKPIVDDWLITDNPKSIIDKSIDSLIDVMIGYSSKEEISFSKDIKDPADIPEFYRKFLITFPRTDFQFDFDSQIYKNMSSEVKSFYFGPNSRITKNDVPIIIDLISDILFNYNIDYSAKAHSRNLNSKTFYYKFSVDDELNVLKMLTNSTSFPGAGHFDEICYLFRCNYVNEIYRSLERNSSAYKMIKTMTKLWSNFAKFGNPTFASQNIEWKLVNRDVTHFMDITNDGLVPGLEPFEERFQFWNELFREYASSARF